MSLFINLTVSAFTAIVLLEKEPPKKKYKLCEITHKHGAATRSLMFVHYKAIYAFPSSMS